MVVKEKEVKAAELPEGFSPVGESEPFRFETKGQKVEGLLIGRFTYKNKKSGLDNLGYRIRIEGDKVVTVFGSARLNRALSEIADNRKVCIIYNGKVKAKSGNEVHDFTVGSVKMGSF